MARTYVIAEAGVNHNGSEKLALELIDAAVAAGADAVKFQTFKAASLTAKHARKAAYQDRTVGDTSQLEMIRALELNHSQHDVLARHARERGIEFLSTPFDSESLSLLMNLGVARLKASSGDLTNLPLLRELGATGLPTILSTGMATLAEVELGLGALASGALAVGEERISAEDAFRRDDGQAWIADHVTLLHCTTEYPTPFEEVNLRVMDTLRSAFGLPVGYSDHTRGITVAIAAVARNAAIIEKHFTLHRHLPGPDHAASLEPAELTAMVRGIREVEQALGSTVKRPSPSEIENIEPARRSLVALHAIGKGEKFTRANLGSKRPGNGISPMRYDEWIGRAASRDYEADELID